VSTTERLLNPLERTQPEDKDKHISSHPDQELSNGASKKTNEIISSHIRHMKVGKEQTKYPEGLILQGKEMS
jgi:hypothetical protein